MNNKQLKSFKNITRIMKSELAYSKWMTACIYATYAAWILRNQAGILGYL